MAVSSQIDLPVEFVDRNKTVPGSGTPFDAAHMNPNFDEVRDKFNAHTHTDLATEAALLQEISDRIAALASETNARIAAIAAEQTDRANADSAEATARITNDASTLASAEGYTDAQVALKVDKTAIDTDTSLAAASDARVASQKAAKAYVDTETNARIAAITNEAALRVAADALKFDTANIDIDAAMAANSDARVPSQKAFLSYFASNSVISLKPIGGGADDGPNLQAALRANSWVRIDGALTLKSVVTVPNPANTILEWGKNGLVTLDAALAGSYAISYSGIQGSSTSLTVDPAIGDETLTMASTAGITVGGVYKLCSDTVFGSTSQKKGEWVRIKSISSGTVVTLYEPISDSYETVAAVAPKIVSATMGISPYIYNPKMVGVNDSTKAMQGILIDTCVNAMVEGGEGYWMNNAFVTLMDCKRPRVSDLHAEDSLYPGLSYVLAVTYCTEDGKFAGLSGYNTRHVVTHGGGTSRYGVPRRCDSRQIQGDALRDAVWDCHPVGEDINVDGVIANCDKNTSETGDGIVHQGASGSIRNYTVKNAKRHGILIQPQTIKNHRHEVGDGFIGGSGSRGITYVPTTGYTNFEGFSVGNPEIINSGVISIDCSNASGGRTKRISIGAPRIIHNGSSSGIKVQSCDNVRVGQASVEGMASAQVPVWYENCVDIDSRVAYVKGSGSGNGIRFVSCSNGKQIGGRAESLATGVLIDATCNFIEVLGFDGTGVATPINVAGGFGHKADFNMGDYQAATTIVPAGSGIASWLKQSRSCAVVTRGGTVTKIEVLNVTALTLGSIASGSNLLTVSDVTRFATGQAVLVIGAGAAGSDLETTIASIAGNVLTLAANASSDVVSGGVIGGTWIDTGSTFGTSVVSPWGAIRWTYSVVPANITRYFLR